MTGDGTCGLDFQKKMEINYINFLALFFGIFEILRCLGRENYRRVLSERQDKTRR